MNPLRPSHSDTPVKAAPLAAAALLDVAQSFGPLLPVWIALTVVNAVSLVAMGQWYAANGHDTAMPLALEAAYGAGDALVAGLILAFAVRAFVGGPGPRWRLSRGVVAFAAVNGVLGLFETLAPELAVQGARAAGLRAAESGGAATAIAFAVWILALAVEVRLVLWQTALAVGDRTVGLGFSWRASRGTVGAYLIAYVLVAGVLTLIHLVGWSYYVLQGSAVGLGAALVSLCGGLMTTTALSAEYYKARMQPGVAAVFE